MATNAFLGSGTTLAAGDTASAANFVTVTEVKTLSGPSADNPQVEVTHMASTSAEFISGLASQGAINVTCNFDPSNTSHMGAAKAILDGFTAKTVRYWRITWSDTGTTTASFQGVVSSGSIETTPNGAVELSFDITITGSVTFA